MRAVLSLILAIVAMLAAIPSQAKDRSVIVVELFTSQGCSSCPPADAFMAELAKHEGVLPLALHVDYWDYIGWKDTFALRENTVRQKGYAYGFGTRSIYTPQVVIDGTEQAVGSHVTEVMELLFERAEVMQPVSLQAIRNDAGNMMVRVDRVAHMSLPDEMLVQIVRFIPSQTVAVRRGENAGRSITSTNIVTDIEGFARWNGRGSEEFDLPMPIAPDGQSAAVLLQAATKKGYPGEILAAILLERDGSS